MKEKISGSVLSTGSICSTVYTEPKTIVLK